MTDYSPYPQVTINGTAVTANIDNSVTISNGRTTIDDQARTSYANITLITYDDDYITVKPNDHIVVSIPETDGTTYREIFGGWVSDIDASFGAWGLIGTINTTQLTAVGSLGKLAVNATAASYPLQYDGDRIYEILWSTVSTQWDEVLPTQTWATVDASVTWLNYDNQYIANIDTPGVYEIEVYSGGVTNALGLSQQVAQSALGVLWEDGSGAIHYDDATHRTDNIGNYGYTEIPVEYISPYGTVSTLSTSYIANVIEVTYSSGTVTGTDATSIATFGILNRRWETLLENQADAQTQLDLYLETRIVPRQNLGAVTIPLHNPDLPDALRDELVSIYNGKPVSIPDLPQPIYLYAFSGFVEGWRWTITRQTAFITLNLSDYALSLISQTWEQVNPAKTWQNMSAAMTWQNARVIV